MLLYMISHLACCLHSFCLSVCGQFCYWFFRLEICMFVCGFLYVGKRLRITPCFLLLQNLLASARYYYSLSACCAYQLVLGSYLLSPLWRSSPPKLFLCHWRDMNHMFLLLSDRRLPFPTLPFFCGGLHIYEANILKSCFNP